jgi:hypothetical protein
VRFLLFGSANALRFLTCDAHHHAADSNLEPIGVDPDDFSDGTDRQHPHSIAECRRSRCLRIGLGLRSRREDAAAHFRDAAARGVGASLTGRALQFGDQTTNLTLGRAHAFGELCRGLALERPRPTTHALLTFGQRTFTLIEIVRRSLESSRQRARSFALLFEIGERIRERSLSFVHQFARAGENVLVDPHARGSRQRMTLAC